MPDATFDTVFCAAIEIASPGERESYIATACGADTELRLLVAKLVDAHFRAGGFLESPEAIIRLDTSESDASSEMVGAYRLLERIGEGGMGTVWMAQQTEPVKRLVAVKLIKAGMDSAQVVARFEAERQALALMDHPNIARVLDGGEAPPTYAGGPPRPYFVMDLVKGVPITKYCDEHRLTPRERLELFVPVCQAVQHAHQKGIVHRDLKPSNVLVALCDEKPLPKIIDFGVAKATGQHLTEQTLCTGYGAVVGTVEYMSPEQATLNQLDVDTRSDVYSLGVLLFELLTGTTPLRPERARETGVLEALRIIREEETPTLSQRLSSTQELVVVAANRGLEPARLRKQLRGDVEWIVMKALEKDRDRRYQTANGLAADVQRFLADEPVLACPPSTGYRLRRFVRKNLWAVLTAAAFAALLLVGVAILGRSNWLLARENQRTQREYDRAQGNLRHALDLIERVYVEVADKRLLRDPRFADEDREYLQIALMVFEEFARQSQADPQVQYDLVRAYRRMAAIQDMLGQNAEAERSVQRAAQILEQLVAANPERVDYRRDLAIVLGAQAGPQVLAGREGGEPLFERAVRLAEQVLAEQPESEIARQQLALIELDHGRALTVVKRRTEAEPHLRRAIAVLQDPPLPSTGHEGARLTLAAAYVDLGKLLGQMHRDADADRAYTEARRSLQELHREFPYAARIRLNLALANDGWTNVLRRAGRSREAEAPLKEGLILLESLSGEFPHVPRYREGLATLHKTISDVFLDLKRPAEAEASRRKALALLERLAADQPDSAPQQSELAAALNNLAVLIAPKPERTAEARRLLERAIPLQQAALRAEPDNAKFRDYLIHHHVNLAEAAVRQGDHVAAAKSARDVLPLVTDSRIRLQAAMCFLRSIPLLEHDAKLSADERTKLAGEYADRAWECVKPISIKGIVAASQLEAAPAFSPLRGRDDFKTWLAEQKANEK